MSDNVAVLPRATVVIPTYNGAARIGDVLKSLAEQDIAGDAFEIVVVDNASTDDTAGCVAAHPVTQDLGNRRTDCRVVREERRGLTFARIRGIIEARADHVCFLDDDNRPDARFVAEALRAFEETDAGLLTSRVFPIYEIPPPPSVVRREHLLAINHQLGSAVRDWGARGDLAPTLGAGMWVRRAAFLKAVPCDEPWTLMCDRIGEDLTSGGDIEIGVLMGRAGYRRVYWPTLVVQHLIPASRLQRDYFTRLIVGVVRSKATLEDVYGHPRSPLRRRLHGLVRLGNCVLAAPFLLCRRDGLQDFLFAFAGRWAEVQGPYRQTRAGR